VKLKIVVDTNILFSAILNPTGRIGKIIINSKKHFQFYTCDFLKTELLKHRKKLLKLAKLTPQELDELEFVLTKNIQFINENLLPEKIILASEKVLTGVDLNDTPFVALTKHLKAKLWTGDKELASGIQSKKFIETLTTSQLSDLLDKLEKAY
jgi:predicted nucleic acid-binding protein